MRSSETKTTKTIRALGLTAAADFADLQNATLNLRLRLPAKGALKIRYEVKGPGAK